jgi:hypothetical protein
MAAAMLAAMQSGTAQLPALPPKCIAHQLLRVRKRQPLKEKLVQFKFGTWVHRVAVQTLAGSGPCVRSGTPASRGTTARHLEA